MTLEILDNSQALENLVPEWSVFARKIDGLTPFQDPVWLLVWWRHFANGHLQVLVFRENQEIAAVIPLFLHTWENRFQLTLLGSGISDYLEPPIAAHLLPEVTAALRTYLLDKSNSQSNNWKICIWQDLYVNTPLAGLHGNPLRVQLTPDTPCSQILLTGSFENFWASRSKDLRRNLRRYTQRAVQDGPLEFAVSDCADPVRLDVLLHALIHLHADRWQKRGESGMIEANRSAAFLRAIAHAFERLRILRFFTLRFQEKIVALSLGFLYRNTLYSYLSAFDPQYEILGFGRKLLYESLQYAYAQHVSAWNFCRGNEPYKFSFGTQIIPKSRLILTRAAAAHTA